MTGNPRGSGSGRYKIFQMGHQIRHCGILILAAGQSKRLGTPKQLLTYEGTTLLARVAELACGSGAYPVVCILGAHAGSVREALVRYSLDIVWNADWMEGMASSLRLGLEEMRKKHPLVDGVMVLVCDQPYLDQALMDRLVRAQRDSGLPVAAASYGGRLGTPVLFHESLFADLMQLKGDTGARVLLEGMRDRVCAVPFEAGAVDIDTKEDYTRLLDKVRGEQ
jgi:molybdenum cofactor cytidylyltransferase